MLRYVPAAVALLRTSLLGSAQVAGAVSRTLKTPHLRCPTHIEGSQASTGPKELSIGSNFGGHPNFSTGRDRNDEGHPSKSTTGVSDDGAPAKKPENISPLGLAYSSAPEQMGPIDQSVESLHLRGDSDRGVGLTEHQLEQAAQPMSPLVEQLDATARQADGPQPAHEQALSKLQGFAAS